MKAQLRRVPEVMRRGTSQLQLDPSWYERPRCLIQLKPRVEFDKQALRRIFNEQLAGAIAESLHLRQLLRSQLRMTIL